MSWKPCFVKEYGFYSPANMHGQYVANFYRTACLFIPLNFAKHYGSISTPLCAAAGGFTLLSVLYYVYAATHQVNAAAQDAPHSSDVP